MLPPTQHYLVWIRLQGKISFVTSFTISKSLKKYYNLENIKRIDLYEKNIHLSKIILKKLRNTN